METDFLYQVVELRLSDLFRAVGFSVRLDSLNKFAAPLNWRLKWWLLCDVYFLLEVLWVHCLIVHWLLVFTYKFSVMGLIFLPDAYQTSIWGHARSICLLKGLICDCWVTLQHLPYAQIIYFRFGVAHRETLLLRWRAVVKRVVLLQSWWICDYLWQLTWPLFLMSFRSTGWLRVLLWFQSFLFGRHPLVGVDLWRKSYLLRLVFYLIGQYLAPELSTLFQDVVKLRVLNEIRVWTHPYYVWVSWVIS